MKNLQKIKQQKKVRRHRRVRAKIKGTAKKPRFSVFRSNKYIYAQLIDDEKGETLVSASDIGLDTEKVKSQKVGQITNKTHELKVGQITNKTHELKVKSDIKGVIPSISEGSQVKNKAEDSKLKDKDGKIGIAFQIGELIAQKALEKKIKQVVFDRGGCKYHGRVKAVAEGARLAGLKF